MILYVLFGQRKDSYPGEFGPEAILCWDEFCVDENPEGFEKACADAIEASGDDFSSTRLVEVTVSLDAVQKALGTARIAGKVAQ